MPQDKRAHDLQGGGTGGSSGDAELVRLGAEFREKHRRHLELIEREQRSAGKPPSQEQEEILSLMQAKQELAEAIARLRATAISGLRVKAAVLLAYAQYQFSMGNCIGPTTMGSWAGRLPGTCSAMKPPWQCRFGVAVCL